MHSMHSPHVTVAHSLSWPRQTEIKEESEAHATAFGLAPTVLGNSGTLEPESEVFRSSGVSPHSPISRPAPSYFDNFHQSSHHEL
jgi:hypothetical protein